MNKGEGMLEKVQGVDEQKEQGRDRGRVWRE